MKTSLILPDDQADGLVPITITVWVKHPELGEVIRDLAESLAISLNVYCDPLAIQSGPDNDAEEGPYEPPTTLVFDLAPDQTDVVDARQCLYPGRERHA